MKEKTSAKSDPLKLSFPQGTTSLHIEYKVACVCRCGMQCHISIIKIKLRENIHCRFPKSFTNNTRQNDLAFPCYYRIYVSLQGRFLRPTSEDNPPTCSFLSIARLQSFSRGSKKRNFGVLKFSPQTRMIIDTGHPVQKNHFGTSMLTNLLLPCFLFTDKNST